MRGCGTFTTELTETRERDLYARRRCEFIMSVRTVLRSEGFVLTPAVSKILTIKIRFSAQWNVLFFVVFGNVA